MPDRTASGLRFAQDLRRIREKKGLSVEHLYNETKIPQSLLQSFEETGLFDHPMFNRVYLRSFVRNYAEVIGVSPDLAVRSLEEAVEGKYTNRLASEYLSEAFDASAEPPVPVAPAIVEQPQAKPSEWTIGSNESSAPFRPSADGLPLTTTVHAEAPTEAPRDEVPWYAQSGKASERHSVRTYSEREGVSRQWLWLLGAAVVLGGIIFFALRGLDLGGGEPDVREKAVTVQDTARSRPAARPAVQAAAPVALPDTIQVIVTAALDKVDPIRVRVDQRDRAPYWLEKGESKTFRFSNSITVEHFLPRLQVQVNGVPYPTNRPDSLGRLVITRDSVASLMRSRGNG